MKDKPKGDPRRVVLLRHGESVWNKENRFTGWTDVDLSDHGRDEGREAVRGLKEHGFSFDVAFTSVLKRAIRTHADVRPDRGRIGDSKCSAHGLQIHMRETGFARIAGPIKGER